ncbi:MAG TPA: copper resistance protein CopC [Steroidobacteraceae bacterium]
MQSKLASAVCGSVLLLIGTVAFAHTTATSTTPKSGSVLNESPPAIEITFKDAARLTAVVVRQAGKPERKLSFSPNTSAKTFTVENPMLEPGKNEVQWTALSADGHVIKGTIVITIKASDDSA